MSQKIQLDLIINSADAVQTIGEAKKSLKELKEAMAFGIPEDDVDSIQKAEEAYKRLKDKVDDVNDSLAANANDGLTKVGDQFKYIKDRIFELDFKNASKGFSQLSTTVKSVNFSQIKEGVKMFGQSLGQLGQVMKTALGPWGLLIVAVVTVTGFLYSLKDSIKPIGELFAWLGSIVSKVVKFFTDLTDAMGLTTVARDKENQSIRDSAELNEQAITGYYGRMIKAAETYHQSTYGLQLEQTRKLAAQYDLERKAASDKFNDIAKMEQYSKTKSKEYYDALAQFQAANQKLNEQFTNLNAIKYQEQERLEKNAFESRQQTLQANSAANLSRIKNDYARQRQAASDNYMIERNALLEAHKTDMRTEAEHKQDLINLNTRYNTQLREANKAFREKENQAKISIMKSELEQLEMAGTRNDAMLQQQSRKRLAIIDEEERQKLSTLIKGTKQYEAVQRDAANKRLQEAERLKQIRSANLTEISNATNEMLNAMLGNVSATGDGGAITSLMMQIAQNEYDNAARLLNENKDKLGNLYYSYLWTLQETLSAKEKAAEKAGKQADAANAQSEMNTKIYNLEADFQSKLASMSFKKQQEYYEQLAQLKKEQREKDMQAELVAAGDNEKKKAEIRAKYRADEAVMEQEDKNDKLQREIQHIRDLETITTDYIESLNNIYDIFDAIRSTKGAKNVEEEEKRAKQRFNIEKAFQLSMAVVQGFSNSLIAWKKIAAAVDPISKAIAIAEFVKVTTSSLALVAKISASQYKSSKTAGGGGDTGGGVNAAPAVNLYGQAGQTNNLSVQNPNRKDNELRVFVVESDITTAQNNVSRYKTSTTLG